MTAIKNQGAFTRGIYEFEDASGCLLAAKIPPQGSVDLYKGTAVTVRPNQCAVFLYKGEVADVLPHGLHYLDAENVPVLTRLANWRFGFQSPLRAELWFFSGNVFIGRRWGTPSPILHNLEGLGTVPIRAFGNYSFFLKDPLQFFSRLVGTKPTYDITEAEDFVQGHIAEFLPEALKGVTTVGELGEKRKEVATALQRAMTLRLRDYGVGVKDVQVLSLLPNREVLEALDAQAALKVVGNPRDLLLYRAANSLASTEDGTANDPMQMMLGLMVGKGLIGADFHQREREAAPVPVEAVPAPTLAACASCAGQLPPKCRFCPHCGKEIR